MGPLVFVTHINDLKPPGPVMTLKYADDTNVLYSCEDPGEPTLQEAASYLSDWSRRNHMKFNINKSKEIIFAFKRSPQDFPLPNIEDNAIKRVHEAKILGITLQADLKWNSHIENVAKKANKRLHLLLFYAIYLLFIPKFLLILPEMYFYHLSLLYCISTVF